MQAFFGLDNLPANFRNVTSAIGVFDGLHRAHMEIIGQVTKLAQQQGNRSLLITFEPHPRHVLKPVAGDELRILTTPREKMNLLQGSQLEGMLFLDTSPDLLAMEAEVFVKYVLVERLKIKDLVVGHDFHFGCNRLGTPDLLHTMGLKDGFRVISVDNIRIGNEIVRSSSIRQLLAAGEIGPANRLLGREYSVSGIVVRGDGRGRGLGFPTANIFVPDKHKLTPGPGIYLVRVVLNGLSYWGMGYIGTRQTFGENDQVIETHLFDFPDSDTYGHEINVSFIEWVRADYRFASAAQLVEQMHTDRQLCQRKIQEYHQMEEK